MSPLIFLTTSQSASPTVCLPWVGRASCYLVSDAESTPLPRIPDYGLEDVEERGDSL